MTEQEIRHVREQWDKVYDRLVAVRMAIRHMKIVKESLEAESQRLAELIAEHDDTEIVIIDDDGEAT